MDNIGIIYGVNGPVIYLKGNTGFHMQEMVYVGKEKLVGEVIALDKDMTTIQVYEETTGLRPGDQVIATGSAVSVTLAPFRIPQSATLFGHNASLVLELPVMFLVMLLLTGPALLRGRLTRAQGVLLLAVYVGFCAVQFML